MVQSPSWAANWFAVSQEIPHISRNPKVHYRTHKRPPPSRIWMFRNVFYREGLLAPRPTPKLEDRPSSAVKLSSFTVWRHTWRKNWVNCAVLTGNSADLRTVFSNHLSHRQLRSSLRESDSFLSLPADTTMASSQGTSVCSNSLSS